MIITDFELLERIIKPTKIYNLYHFRSLKGFSLDSRSIKKGEGFIALRGKYRDGHKFIQKAVAKGATLVIGEKYISLKPKRPFFIVDNTYDALKSIVSYIRKKKNPLVYGITGSVGKTTTKEILYFLLKPYFKVLKNEKTENNLLGVAKTFFSLKDEKIVILELGTNTKGEVESLAQISTPDIGIITFIKPAHLEGLKDLRGVFEEKVSLLKANSAMKAVLNHDDPYLSSIKRRFKTYWFGRGRNNSLFYRLTERKKDYSSFLIQDKYELKVPYYLEGFIVDYLAAIGGANLMGIPLEELTERANHFHNFLPMRMEMKELNKCLLLNDAYNANPYSFQQALKVLKNYSLPKIIVIGDMLELGKKSRYYHEQLASQIIEGNWEWCLTLGRYSFYLKEKLKQLGYRHTLHFYSHRDIARFINKKIGASKNVKKRYLIFLKGSRKMELEKVRDYLK